MKKRARKNVRPAALARNESIHFRLCHLCLNLNEAADEVIRCEKCGHDYHSISDYLMSDEVDLVVGEDESEGMEDADSLERLRARGSKRLNGLVAVL